jgi:uncharacterized spore protein YtfJ
MPSTKNADAETGAVPRRRTDELLSTLVERLGGRLATTTVYGTPVEREGVTIVPVAAARFGVGAGSGSDPAKGQQGDGGGGGGTVTPTGYIEIRDGRSRYVPVVDPARMVMLVLSAVLAGVVLFTRRGGDR